MRIKRNKKQLVLLMKILMLNNRIKNNLSRNKNNLKYLTMKYNKLNKLNSSNNNNSTSNNNSKNRIQIRTQKLRQRKINQRRISWQEEVVQQGDAKAKNCKKQLKRRINNPNSSNKVIRILNLFRKELLQLVSMKMKPISNIIMEWEVFLNRYTHSQKIRVQDPLPIFSSIIRRVKMLSHVRIKMMINSSNNSI